MEIISLEEALRDIQNKNEARKMWRNSAPDFFMPISENDMMAAAHENRPIKYIPEYVEGENPFDVAYRNSLGPFLIGAGNMLNDTVIGGSGWILSNLGRGVEYISPFSGIDKDRAGILRTSGFTENDINQLLSHEDSWLTSMSKSLLGTHNSIADVIDSHRQYVMGDNPNMWQNIVEGTGSSIGFLGAGALASGLAATPLIGGAIGALTSGGLEALSEAGSFMGDAYKNGKFDEGLSTANKSFIANALLNSGLDFALGRFNPKIRAIEDPAKRWLYGAGLEVINEILQEPSQQIIENAATDELKNPNTGFISNLLNKNTLPNWFNTFTQLAPEVAGSTMLTELLLGGRGAYRHFKRNLDNRNNSNQFRNQPTEAQLINERNEKIAELDEVISRIDQIHKTYGREAYTIPVINEELSTLHSRKSELDDKINNIWKDRGISSTPTQDDDLDLFPDRDNINLHLKNNNPPDDNNPPAPPTAPNAPADDDDFRIENLTPFGRGNQNNNTRPASSLSNSPEGNTARVRTMRGTEADIRYRIVDADDLITSTKDTGAPNPDYPQEFQPRQRNRDASIEQVNRIANNLDPELVADNRLASDGAPIIGSDLVVESGNGRVMGIRQAYRTGKAENYRSWLRNNASRFGLSPDYVDSIKNPVLVRERISDVDRVQFTREANESSTAQMSATENALNDAEQISGEMLALFDSEKSVAGNKDFAVAFSRIIPKSERGNFMQSNGNISVSGLNRIRNALAAKAYNNTDILNRLDELFDDDIKNVSNALINAAPKIALLENGGYKPDLSIRDDIVQAVNTLAALKKEGIPVDAFFAQLPMFDDISDNAKRLILFFDKNKRSAKRISQGLIHYAETAMNQGFENQFGIPGLEDAVMDKSAILKEAMNFADSLKSESYNQSDYTGNERSDVGHITANDNGQNVNLTVETGEFSDKYQKQKKFFGKFLNIKDSKTGRIIARYAPYTGKLQMLDENASPALRQQIENTIRNNLAQYLEQGGFIDENGKLKDDGNNEYRRQYRSRLDTTPEGKSVHDFNKRGNKRNPKSWFRRTFDRLRFSKQERKALETIREDIAKKIRSLVFHNIDGLEFHIPEQDAEFYAAFYAAETLATAHAAGVSVEDYYKIRNLQFKTKILRKGDKAILGNTEFIPAGYTDKKTGEYYPVATTVVTLSLQEVFDEKGNAQYLSMYDLSMFKDSENINVAGFNKSTLIHEGYHIFLRAFQDVMRLDNIPEQKRQDWLKLVKWLGISDIDLSKPTDQMTDDEKRRMTNAHEKFAVAGEHFTAKGKAPVSWLKRVFNTFKQWLLDVYGVITKAQYAGSDGRHHDVVVPKEIEAVFKRMFKDYGLSPDEDNLRTLREMAGREGESEVHNQTVNEEYETAHHESLLQSHSPIRRTNDTFVSQQDIERFEQLAYHGSGHIILNNRFNLAFLGTGEGNQAFGWGLYFAQNKDVAENFRAAGLDNSNASLAFSLSNGLSFSDFKLSQLEDLNSDNPQISGLPDNVTTQGLFEAIKDLTYRFSENYGSWDFKAQKKSLLREYNDIAKRLRSQGRNNQLRSLNQAIKALKALNNLDFNNYKKGNIYQADIPESYTLLDLHAPLEQQSDYVLKAIQKVLNKLHDKFHIPQNVINSIADSQYGEDFYQALSHAMRNFVKNGKLASKKLGKISNPDMAASLLLNQAGITGSQYWDKGSRDYKSGTRNFVIWNTDMITLLGLDDTSDTDAKDYFNAHKNNEKLSHSPIPNSPNSIGRATGTAGNSDKITVRDMIRDVNDAEGNPYSSENEAYNQIISVKGARELDRAEGSTYRMDMLKLARKLERNGKSSKILWLNTGWMRGADGKWRYEIMDGKLKARNRISKADYNEFQNLCSLLVAGNNMSLNQRKKLNRLANIIYDTTLDDVFDAPELFNAYPELRNVRFVETPLDNGIHGFTKSANGKHYITLNSRLRDNHARSVLVHEIQHVIQNIEGLATGGSPDMFTLIDANLDITDVSDFAANAFRRQAQSIYRQISPKLRKKFRSLKISFDNALANGQLSEDEQNSIVEREFSPDIAPLFNDFYNFGLYADYYSDPSHIAPLERAVAYRMLAGEEEAHNVQKRINMTRDERRLTPLDETEDKSLPRERQLVSDANGKAFSRNPENYNQSVQNDSHENNIIVRDMFGEVVQNFDDDENLQEALEWIYDYRNQQPDANLQDIIKQIKSDALDSSLYGAPDFFEAFNLYSFSDNNSQDITTGVNENGEEVNIYAPKKQIADVRKKYQSTDKWMKAPNGKTTKLTEKQWLLVRTPNFKRWFGDWENDPKHASKVIDENGEPLVVYHGSPNFGFSVFDTNGEGMSYDTGAWFTSSRDNAETYASDSNDVYATFLNIRTPYIIDANGKHWDELSDIHIVDEVTGKEFYENDNGEPFKSHREAKDYIIDKVDDGSFDVDDDAKLYESGDPFAVEDLLYGRYRIETDAGFSHTNEIARGIFNGEYAAEDYDGVIFKNIYDSASHRQVLSDVFVVRKPNNIKSATRNNDYFDSKNPDIYYQIIGINGARQIDLANGNTNLMDNLAVARQMERNAVPVKTMWAATGWMRGADGQWKYEIPDGKFDSKKFNDLIQMFDEAETLHSKMKIVPDNNGGYTFTGLSPDEENRLDTLNDAVENVKLSDVFDAPELFYAYPELKNIEVAFDNKSNTDTIAEYDPDLDFITFYTEAIRDMKPNEIRRTLIHEIQHAVQDREGFASGGSLDSLQPEANGKVNLKPYFRRTLMRKRKVIFENLDKKIQRKFNHLRRKESKLSAQEFNALKNKLLNENEKLLYDDWRKSLKLAQNLNKHGHKISPEKAYWLIGGEEESRNTENRADLSPEERRNKPLSETEDHNRNAHILLNRYGEHYSEQYNQLDIPDNQTERVRKQYQGTDKWLKAPNGKPTNLTEKQWLQVRTPNFKQWFGDWENDPEHASKILDDNGEPLIVYHGTTVPDIKIFKRSTKGWLGPAIYLTPYRAYANDYTKRGKNGTIMALFLNVRNPLQVKTTNPMLELLTILYGDKAQDIFNERYEKIRAREIKGFTKKMGEGKINAAVDQNLDRVIKRYIISDNELQKILAKGDYDGISWFDPEELQDLMSMPDYNGINFYNTEFAVLNSRQIKSATDNNGEFNPNNPDIYFQTVSSSNFDESDSAHSAEAMLTTEAQTQIKRIRKKYEGTEQWLKAPNGEDSNLDELHWLLVRTPNFKKWFGDWEKHPENASKVLDANGEPLPVFHGSKHAGFSVFDTTKGAWFSDSRDTSDSYINGSFDSDYDDNTYSVFLNIRNPLYVDYDGKGALDDGNEAPSYWLENSNGYDGVICSNIKDRGDYLGGYAEQDEEGNFTSFYDDNVYGVKSPNQIKSATDNNGMFSDNPDIYYQTTQNTEHDSKKAVSIFSSEPDTEAYFQIGAKRKNDMNEALAKSRPDLTQKQRAEAINEIEKLGESVRQGGYPKVEKLATHWLMHGHVILPEDNYKIIDAIRISEQHHLDPMRFDDPNTILAQFTIKEKNAEKRINPDSVPEFSNKVLYDNGITVYNVEDSREGQAAVRLIIDTHWGEDANPWCLAARDEDGELDTAWDWWKHYDGVDKRIAFKDGKLLAFCADTEYNKWWDREDNDSEYIPYTVKENGNTYEYCYNEDISKTILLREALSDGTIRDYYSNDNGQLSSESFPDGTLRRYFDDGQLAYERLPDMSEKWWRISNGEPEIAKLPDGTVRRYYPNGQLLSETLPDGTVHSWYLDEQIKTAKLPDRTTLWDKKGRQLQQEILPDGTEREYHTNGVLAYETLPDGTKHTWYKNGQIKSETLVDGTMRDWYDNGQLESEKLPDGTKRNWRENGQLKFEKLLDGTIHQWLENGQFEIEELPDGKKNWWYINEQSEKVKLPTKEVTRWKNKYGNLKNYLNEYKRTHPDGFINADAIEHFDQLHTHATGHIILDNKFDLRYVGTGEGGAMFGHGIYLEEAPELAEHYRTYGLPNRGLGTIHIHSNDGFTYSSDDIFAPRTVWTRSDGKIVDDGNIRITLNSYAHSLNAKDAPTHNDIQKKISRWIKNELNDFKKISSDKKNYEHIPHNFEGAIADLQAQLDFLNSLTGFEPLKLKKGNVYLVDIPEDYELLDWDKSLKNQPKDVLNKLQDTIDNISNNPAVFVAKRFSMLARNPKTAEKSLLRIIQNLTSPEHKGQFLHEREFATLPEFKTIKRLIMPAKKRNISVKDNIDEFISAINSLNLRQSAKNLKPSATGGDLYHTLSDLLGSQEAASMYLNSLGIPGHRYFDRQSRAKSKGTHNFVIWNVNRLTIIGLEGDKEAVDYFRDTALQKLTGNPNESYNQLIGAEGAARLDKIEGNTVRMDGLRMAENLEKQNISAKRIWLATGWNKAKDGEWRYEIPDGDFDISLLYNLGRGYVELQDIYESETLYHAYPDLKYLPVKVTRMAENKPAKYDAISEIITVNKIFVQNDDFDTITSALIHEIQHAVQDIEGFEIGTTISKKAGSLQSRIKKLIHSQNNDTQDKLINAYNNMINGNDNLSDEAVSSMSVDEKAVWNKVMKLYSKLQDEFENYRRSAGETEARNAQTRYNMSQYQRIMHSPDETEDVPRDKQILLRSNFISDEQIERFNQQMWHGTRHSLIGNKFDLRFLSSGEGSQAYGYGIYLAQAKGTGESYRKAGNSDQMDAPPFWLSNKNGNTFSLDDLKLTITEKLKKTEYSDRIYEILLRLEHGLNEFFDTKFKRKNTNNYSHFNDFQDVLHFTAIGAVPTDLYNKQTELSLALRPGDKNPELKAIDAIVDNITDNVQQILAPLFPVELKPNPDYSAGNLYSVDGPEDFELLDWDVLMSEQPQHVLDALKRGGLDFDDNQTGEDFYHTLSTKLEIDYALEKHIIERGDKLASMKLNELGIPGLRFWDSFSRKAKSGTHNFVIWNTDTLNVLGISDDSDFNAQEYFRAEDLYNAYMDSLDNDSDSLEYSSNDYHNSLDEYANASLDALDNRPDYESYQQLIGENGARQLDLRNGNNDLINALNTAIRMERELAPKWKLNQNSRKQNWTIDNENILKIWQATGWFRGVDGKWRYELPYGQLSNNFDNIRNSFTQNKSSRNSKAGQVIQGTKLNDVFDAPELFYAYPQLNNVFVNFEHINGAALAKFIPEKNLIVIDSDNNKKLRPVLIHEIQHIIQHIEGFAEGGNQLTGFFINDTNAADSGNLNKNFYKAKFFDLQAHSLFEALDDNTKSLFSGTYDNIKDLSRTKADKLIREVIPDNLRSLFDSWRMLLDKGIYYSKAAPRYLDNFDSYWRFAGEVEARNASTRSSMSDDERRNNPPSFTQSVRDDEQIILDNQNDNLNPENYNQLIGTEGAIRNSKPASSTESYNQIIGKKGAIRTDAANGNHVLINNLNVAKIMENRNFHPDKIWFATGWFRGVDGEWKYEIPDGKLKSENDVKHAFSSFIRHYLTTEVQKAILNNGYKPVFTNNPVKLKDIFDAPELYKAYPKLENFYVDAAPLPNNLYAITNAMSVFFPKMGAQIIININSFNNFNHNDMQKAMLHEIQHVIQLIEGFAFGNNMSTEAKAKFNKILSIIRDYGGNFKYHLLAIVNALQDKNINVAKNIAYGLPEEFRPVAAKIIRDFASFLNASEDYIFSAGEAEARNVVAREHLTPEQRKHTPPYKTSDVPQEKQIPTFLHVSDDSESDLHGKPETYEQSFNEHVHSEDAFLSPEGKKQIERVRKKYQGTEQWLKAPNGNDSNLTELQWLQVRTQNFKRWFGDWEKHPEHASKILDANGEPLVLYHGTPNSGFFVFNTNGDGAWFTPDIKAAKGYSLSFSDDNNGIYPVFLNIRHPYIHDALGADWHRLANVTIRDEKNGYNIYVGDADNPIGNKQDAWEYINDYLLRDELGNLLDNEDEDGNPLYSVKSNGLETTRDIVRAVWNGKLGDGNHDGVIIKDVVDPDYLMDDYIVPEANQIKSATRNNGDFSEKPEIYQQIIGEKGARGLDRAEGVNTRIDNLLKAKIMHKNKISPQNIRLATGWEFAPDGKWRYEIQDTYINSQALFDAINTHGDNLPFSMKLHELYDNKTLFNAYPQIKNMPVIFRQYISGYDDKTLGIYVHGKDKHIELKAISSIEKMRSVLIHEIQHAVQDIEGFAQGGYGSLSVIQGKQAVSIGKKFLHALLHTSTPNVRKAARLYMKGDSNKANKLAEAMLPAEKGIWKRVLRTINDINHSQFRVNSYNYLGGEIEARNAEYRADFSDEQRRNNTLESTQEHDDWLVVQDDKPQNFSIAHDFSSKHESYNQNTNDERNFTHNHDVRAADVFFSNEGNRQIEAVRKLYQGTSQWLKAPNGKKTNLTELQWLQVRTPNFKKWFGDWINDKENASKILDENGEPLIVWHGSNNNDFSIFDKRRISKRNDSLKGFFFAPDFRRDSLAGYYGHGNERAFFLNIRNPLTDFRPSSSDLSPAQIKNHDGIIARSREDWNKRNFYNHRTEKTEQEFLHAGDIIEIIAFEPEQIKSAYNNNGDFNPENPDIYKQSAADSDINKKYFDALNTGDTDTARSIVDEQARVKGYTSNPDDYRMPHRAPNRQYDFNLNNINHDDYFMPKDLWTHPELYFSSREEIATIHLLKRAADNHSDVTVYRAVIDSVKDSKLRNGDWVTTDRNYAVQHGEQHLRAPYRIIQDNVPLKHLWWDGNSPLELGFDDGNNYAYRNTKNNRKLNDTVVRDDNGNIVPPSKRFNYRKPESYYQQNPFVSRYSFSDDETEKQFRMSRITNNPADNKKSLKHYLLDALHGLSGDFPELATKQAKQKDLIYAREVLRMLKRKSDAQIQMSVHSLSKSLDALSPEQFDIFTRMLLINDIYAFKRQNPNAPLPLGFTNDSLKAERIRFSKLIQNQPDILKAAQDEANLNSKIKNEFASLARELGLSKLAEKITRNEFNSAMLDYANIISPNHNNINANYIHAMGTFRAQQLQDILRLQAIRDIKAKYDIKDKLIRQFGSQWGLHIPSGYKSFNILAGHFIETAHSLHENILGKALEATAQQLGLSDETIKQIRESVYEKSGSQLLVLPSEIVDSILYMLKPKQRGPFAKLLRYITGAWKKLVLYLPTRVAKYNLRNLTGDLDAVIAGNPHALKFLKQAVSELYDAYLGNAKNITPELLEFQKRGGAITTETSQELYDYHKLKQFKHLVDAIDEKNPNSWKSIPAKTWEFIDKFAWSGVQNLTDFREAWLRYACYLSYLNQMQNDLNGEPDNWGASVPDEVLNIPDIRDRAFKMSNELLGAYDQVSKTGQSLRELFIPFYSWLEVNAKRYYQLLKNGVSSDKPVDFMIRSLEGMTIKSPVYAYRIGKTLFMVNLLSLLVKAFNHFVWPDDEDKLPPDIKERPHITLGHDPITGDILYFDRIGAIADNLEWFRGDSFFSDIKAILDGKLSVTQWVKMLLAAPVNKVMQGINPLFKTPFELATGKSLYPDFTNPRNIQDRFKYIAQSLGLNWPFKIISGEPHSNWDEFRTLFVYGSDADEAAYFYTLNLVRQFRENVLGKRSGGFSYSQRGLVLQNLKKALRVNDKDAINRYLQEYFRLNGNNKGLKTSLRNLNPLHSLSKREQAQFLNWISDDDRIYFDRANSYVQTLINRFAER